MGPHSFRCRLSILGNTCSILVINSDNAVVTHVLVLMTEFTQFIR